MIRGDFLNIIEVDYKWKGTLARRLVTDMIVLHHAEATNCTVADIHQWHLNRGWSGIGYNFFIRKNGEIYRGRPEWAVGAHASGYNSRSIGICFEGNFMKEQMTETQIKAGQELVAYLKDKYNISNVKRHKEVNDTDCPGTNFPFNEVVIFQAKGDDIKMINVELPVLKRGAKCNEVGTLQILLNAKGYTDASGVALVVDNSFGAKTDYAVRNFQKEKELEVDGSVGFYTWIKLLRG